MQISPVMYAEIMMNISISLIAVLNSRNLKAKYIKAPTASDAKIAR